MSILLSNQTAKSQRLGNSIAINGFTVSTRRISLAAPSILRIRFKLPRSGFNGFLLFVGRLAVGFKRHSEPPLACGVTVDLTDLGPGHIIILIQTGLTIVKLRVTLQLAHDSFTEHKSVTIYLLNTTNFRLLAPDINSNIYEYGQLIKGKTTTAMHCRN